MPPRNDRDFPVSQYFAKLYGEQTPQLSKKRSPTPDERSINKVLDILNRLTGFEPPKKDEVSMEPVEPPGDDA